MSEPAQRGVCSGCRRSKYLDADGNVVEHTVTWQVSKRAVVTVGRGSGKGRCAGSGKAPLDQR